MPRRLPDFGLRVGRLWFGQVEAQPLKFLSALWQTTTPACLFSSVTSSQSFLFRRRLQSGEIQDLGAESASTLHWPAAARRPREPLCTDQQGHTLVVSLRGRSEPDRPQPEMDFYGRRSSFGAPKLATPKGRGQISGSYAGVRGLLPSLCARARAACCSLPPLPCERDGRRTGTRLDPEKFVHDLWGSQLSAAPS